MKRFIMCGVLAFASLFLFACASRTTAECHTEGDGLEAHAVCSETKSNQASDWVTDHWTLVGGVILFVVFGTVAAVEDYRKKSSS